MIVPDHMRFGDDGSDYLDVGTLSSGDSGGDSGGGSSDLTGEDLGVSTLSSPEQYVGSTPEQLTWGSEGTTAFDTSTGAPGGGSTPATPTPNSPSTNPLSALASLFKSSPSLPGATPSTGPSMQTVALGGLGALILVLLLRRSA